MNHMGYPSRSPTKESISSRETDGPRSRPLSTTASSVTDTPELSLPPYPQIPGLGRSGVGEKHSLDGQPLGPHETAWDHNHAAQQLVGLSQEGPQHTSGLQHERPVPTTQILPNIPMDLDVTMINQAPMMMGNALDVDDLQNLFPWDLYGLMEIGEAMSQNGTEDGRSQAWAANY